MPAIDDEFGIEIDIEQIGKDIDKTFDDIEAEILKLGEPEELKDVEGGVLVGEADLNEAEEGGNLIIDFLFKRPKNKYVQQKF